VAETASPLCWNVSYPKSLSRLVAECRDWSSIAAP
jgi:hypothetical protein